MRKFNFRLLAAFLALTLFSAYTTLAVTSRTPIKQSINNTTGADALIQNPTNRGEGGRGGRQALAALGRGPPPTGSPIASLISVHHNIPSPTDNLLDTFLQVSPTTHAHRTPVDVAHAKKVAVASKPRVLAPRPRPNPWHGSKNSTHHNIHQHRLARATLTLPKYITELRAIPNKTNTHPHIITTKIALK